MPRFFYYLYVGNILEYKVNINELNINKIQDRVTLHLSRKDIIITAHANSVAMGTLPMISLFPSSAA